MLQPQQVKGTLSEPHHRPEAAAGSSLLSPCRWRPAPAPSREAAGRRRPATAAPDRARRDRGRPRPTKASKNYNLQFIQGVAGDEFYITMQCGIEAEAAKLGVTVNDPGPAEVRPHPAEADPGLGRRRQAGRHPDRADRRHRHADAARGGRRRPASRSSWSTPPPRTRRYAASAIASDNEGGGKAAFDAIKQLNPDGGKVMVMSVDPGISTTDARAKGFEDAVKADSKFEYLGVQYSHNDPATAANLISSALQKDPDIVGVFAANLFAAEGTATGVRQAGKTGPGQDRRLRRRARTRSRRCKEGTVQALVAQQPGIIGQYGVDAAVAALDGGEVTPKVQTGFTVITKDNVDGDGADADLQVQLLSDLPVPRRHARRGAELRHGLDRPAVLPVRREQAFLADEGHLGDGHGRRRCARPPRARRRTARRPRRRGCRRP